MASQPLLLEGRVDQRDHTIEQLRIQLRQLDEALRLERNKTGQIEAGVRELRRVLNPLHNALRLVYGEMDAMELTEAAQPPVDSRKQKAWDNWKAQLGGLPGRFIDALLLHGEMTQTQLRIAVGCAQGSVAGAVCSLNKAGLINKNGGKISLKEL